MSESTSIFFWASSKAFPSRTTTRSRPTWKICSVTIICRSPATWKKRLRLQGNHSKTINAPACSPISSTYVSRTVASPEEASFRLRETTCVWSGPTRVSWRRPSKRATKPGACYVMMMNGSHSVPGSLPWPRRTMIPPPPRKLT